MATAVGVAQHRSRAIDDSAYTQSGFTCTPLAADRATCMRVLWEDDRIGRIAEVVELPTGQHGVQIEVPAGRTAAGITQWTPLEQLAGAHTEAVERLLVIVRELAGDVFTHTAPLRVVEPFTTDDEPRYGGIV